MKADEDKYYLGLDVGTGSVGWAVTDDKFELKNVNNKNTWGVRLFPTAETNDTRREKRTARRRYARRKQRILWLRDLLKNEINKIDPKFFERLETSQFHLNDETNGTYLEKSLKNITKTDKNSLFNDKDYKDKDYFTDFPTIWHLRKYLQDNSKKVDLRHYYLAISHILKHRGHFLFSSFSTSEFKTDNEVIKKLMKSLTQEKYNSILDFKWSPENPDVQNPKDDLIKNASKEDTDGDEDKITNEQQLIKLILGGGKTLGEVKLEFSKLDEVEDHLRSSLEPEVFEIVSETYKYYLYLDAKHLMGDKKTLEDYYLEKYKIDRHKQLREFAFPRQLNEKSLELILEKAPISDDIKKKIKQIFEFRIPYYIGPLDDRSKHAWVVRKDEGKRKNITPWNFSKIIDEEKTKEAFYKSLINKCTFLPKEDVLAKSTILNQKYLVLEQINNMKIGGERINKDVAKIIYDGFLSEKQNKTSIKKLLKEKEIDAKDLKLQTESKKGKEVEVKLHQMSSYLSFSEIFGEEFTKEAQENIDEFIKLRTMDVEIETALKNSGLKVSDEQKTILKKFLFDGWSRYSRKFLNEVKDNENQTIISRLEDDAVNIMEIIGDFQENIDKENSKNIKTYQDLLNERWFNPIAKRPIIQTLKIIAELKRTFKKMPEEIFIESTRDLDIEGKNKGKETKSKAQELKEKGLYNGGDFDAISNKKYLFLIQDKKCIYCEKKLEEATAEIEHIQPRSKKFSDSLHSNLALSCRDCNQKKGDNYPITLEWLDDNQKEKTREFWKELLKNNRITNEKYKRLSSTSEIDSLGFIPRQLVATGVIAVTLKNILKMKYPETKITFVKPGLSKILRQEYSKSDENGNRTLIKPEFVKSRVANNFHHAKDAYLALISGRVYNYISGKYRDIGNAFLTGDDGKPRSMSKLFYPTTSIGNNGAVWSEEHFGNMLKTMRKNKETQFCVTYLPQYGDGQFFDETVYKISDNPQFSRKKGLDPEKYGGYKSGKTFGFKIENGKVSNILNKDKNNASGKCFGINQDIYINDSKNIRILSNNDVQLFFDHTVYNFEFSDEQAKLLNRLERLFVVREWQKKDELTKKFNVDELIKLLKWIDGQIPKTVPFDMKVVEVYENDLVKLLEQLKKRLEYMKNNSPKNIENNTGKPKNNININKYIIKSDIESLKNQTPINNWFMANKKAVRIIVFFDLPTDTSLERKKATKFRKQIMEFGFSMLQYSVYTKIVLNHTQKESVEKTIERIAEELRIKNGDISILSISENQFAKMKWIKGKTKSDLLQSYDRLIEL